MIKKRHEGMRLRNALSFITIKCKYGRCGSSVENRELTRDMQEGLNGKEEPGIGKEKKQIVVIGSYAVGMTISCGHFPAAGETVPGKNFSMMHGGKGSNQAVAISRLGGSVVFGGCIGRDRFGDMCLELMQEEGVDSSDVRRTDSGRSTGVGLIYVNDEGENEIVIDFAANEELSAMDIERLAPKIQKSALVLAQLEIPPATVLYAAKKCHELGVPFVLNPAPYQKLPEELPQYCDYLIPNQTEARLRLGLDASSNVPDIEAAQRIWKMGVKNVIMTLGAGGALLLDSEKTVKIEGMKVKTVDTTGAGDTFCGAFCVALAEGKTAEEAVRFAVRAAGLSVTRYGVIPSIPYRQDLDD